MNSKLNSILNEFDLKSKIIGITENTQGNINFTYVIECENGSKYLLQKINTSVFKEPYLVMKNIELVTEHINMITEDNEKNLKVIKTSDNSSLVVYTNDSGEHEYYRMYNYIDNTVSYDSLNDTDNALDLAYNAGSSFGRFHKYLNDFPIDSLSETIPNFHNTPKRFLDMIQSVQNNVKNRSFEYSREIVDLITKSKECSVIYNKLGNSIPYRVTHNDTKLNNVMIDKNTSKGVAVIDLDTVMPGSILYDIGDGIRSACSNSSEDETDKEKIFLNMDYTKAYLDGFLEETADILTPSEINNIALSIKTITYELALRFLTDYINGDTYFKIKYPHHNADRFINQYTLLLDIEKKLKDIQKYSNNCVKKKILIKK